MPNLQNVLQFFNDVWDFAAHGMRVTVTNPSAAGGDASAANQVTEIAKLTSIDGKLPANAPAQGTGVVNANTLRVVQASDGPSVTALGAVGDAAVTDSTANASIIAALKGVLLLNKVSTGGGQGNKAVTTAGTPQQLAAASTPCTNVIISARIGNTKEVAYGFSNAVRATAGGEIGATLQPGDSVALRVNNLQAIWLDAQVSGEGVSYTYTTD